MAELPAVLVFFPVPEVVLGLRRRGITLLGPGGGPLSPSRRVVDCPVPLPSLGPGDMPPIEAVRRIGALHPGAVLLPGSDGTAFWVARNQEQLGAFRCPTVSAEATYTLLNKRLLAEACREADVATPASHLLRDKADLMDAPQMRFPALLKPQTRIGLQGWTRGIPVRDRSALADKAAAFHRDVRFSDEIVAFDPLIPAPLLQEYHPSGHKEICVVTGYIGREGQGAAMRAHRKLLQYPRRLGNALCAEPTPVVPELRSRLLRLARHVGFHGMFDAEFVRAEDEYLLIDFNPRPFNGIGLSAARGLPLAWLAYLDAAGLDDLLADELGMADRTTPDEDAVFCRRFHLQVMLAGQLVSGGMSLREAWGWWQWYRRNRAHMVDPFDAPGDPWVHRRHVASMLLNFARNPSYLAGTFFKRT